MRRGRAHLVPLNDVVDDAALSSNDAPDALTPSSSSSSSPAADTPVALAAPLAVVNPFVLDVDPFPPPGLLPPDPLELVSLALSSSATLLDDAAAFVLVVVVVLLFAPPSSPPSSPCCTAICAVLPDMPDESYTQTCTSSAHGQSRQPWTRDSTRDEVGRRTAVLQPLWLPRVGRGVLDRLGLDDFVPVDEAVVGAGSASAVLRRVCERREETHIRMVKVLLPVLRVRTRVSQPSVRRSKSHNAPPSEGDLVVSRPDRAGRSDRNVARIARPSESSTKQQQEERQS